MPIPRSAMPAARSVLLAGLVALLAGCAGSPLLPYDTDTPVLVRVPSIYAGVDDQRARFRQIFCTVLAQSPQEVPDHRACDDALTRLKDEPAPLAAAALVPSSPARRPLVALLVPGIGYECVAPWLQASDDAAVYLQRRGYGLRLLGVDALSGSERNAQMVRDTVMSLPAPIGPPELVLVGYSKGIADILEAVVAYPQLRSRVAAVVSLAGAVAGSPLANDAEQWTAELMQYFPGARCGPGDGGGVQSLRPGPRQQWLATHRLPQDLRFYSVVTFPQPERISAVLWPSYRKLSAVDARNDGQLLFSDQVIPGSTLLATVNADHWAVALPIARSHPTLAALFVTQNAYPREALLEAVLRYIDEDLAAVRR